MSREEKTPEWLVERMSLGEAPRASAAEVELASKRAEVQERLRALDRSSEALLTEVPPERFASEVKALLSAPSARARSAGWRIPASVTAALLVVVGWSQLSRNRAVESTERVKGLRPALLAFRRGGQGVEMLADHSEARSGDQIQLRYVAAGAREGVVVSIDGAGRVTRHFPLEGSSSAPLVDGAEVSLRHSYELDAAPGFERFIFITARHAFPVKEVMSAARALAVRGDAKAGALVLSFSADQSSLFLRKAP